MNKTNFKKVFSVFLSVLMILSCWVWVAPHEHTHANAAEVYADSEIKSFEKWTYAGISSAVPSFEHSATLKTDHYGNVLYSPQVSGAVKGSGSNDCNPTSQTGIAAATFYGDPNNNKYIHLGLYYANNTVLFVDGKNETKMPVMFAGRMNHENFEAWITQVYPVDSTTADSLVFTLTEQWQGVTDRTNYYSCQDTGTDFIGHNSTTSVSHDLDAGNNQNARSVRYYANTMKINASNINFGSAYYKSYRPNWRVVGSWEWNRTLAADQSGDINLYPIGTNFDIYVINYAPVVEILEGYYDFLTDYLAKNPDCPAIFVNKYIDAVNALKAIDITSYNYAGGASTAVTNCANAIKNAIANYNTALARLQSVVTIDSNEGVYTGNLLFLANGANSYSVGSDSHLTANVTVNTNGGFDISGSYAATDASTRERTQPLELWVYLEDGKEYEFSYTPSNTITQFYLFPEGNTHKNNSDGVSTAIFACLPTGVNNGKFVCGEAAQGKYQIGETNWTNSTDATGWYQIRLDQDCGVNAAAGTYTVSDFVIKEVTPDTENRILVPKGTTYVLPNPTRTGYTFNGWSGATNGSVVNGKYTAGAAEDNLVANWTINNHTVKFVDIAGKVVSEKTYPYGTLAENIEVPANTAPQFHDTNTHKIYKWQTRHNVTGDATYYEDSGDIVYQEHTIVDTVVPPTCTEDGYTNHYCDICKGEYNDAPVTATGHKDTVTREKAGSRVNATCGKDGSYVEEIFCKTCQQIISERTVTIPATGNHEMNAATCTEAANCKKCDYTEGNPLDHTPGSAVQEKVVAATCTSAGSYEEVVYCTVASCKAEISRTPKTTEQLAHELGDYIIDVYATCTTSGSKHKECANCDYATDAVEIPATNHSYDSGVVTKEATCIVNGTMKYTCTNSSNGTPCGHSYTEEIIAVGHNLVKVEEKAPTCIADGNDEYQYCATCGEFFSAAATKFDGGKATNDYIIKADAKYHAWGEPDVTPPTCTDDGLSVTTCLNCGGFKTTYPKATGHDFDTTVVAKAATCTEAGNLAYKFCDKCDCYFAEDAKGDATDGKEDATSFVLPATNHRDTLVQVEAKEPTCNEVGYDAYEYCTVCTYTTKGADIPVLEHIWSDYTSDGDGQTNTHTRTCTRGCGATDKVAHTWDDGEITTAPGCTTEGVKTYNCTALGCEGKYTEEIIANNHTPGAEADCENDQTCTVCGEVLTEKLGHTPGAAADCVNDQTCTVCGAVLTEKLGHTSGAEADCENDQTCTVCGEVLTEKLGHNYGEFVAEIPATCVKEGVKAHYTCSVCSKNFDADKAELASLVIEKNENHALDTAAAKAVTCDYPGWDAYEYCTREGCTYSTKTEKPALGHKYVGVETQAPTCTDKGEMTYTCANDSTHTYKEEINALGHSFKTTEAYVAPGCTTNGHEAYKECNTCGNFFAENEGEASLNGKIDTRDFVIGATGHSYGAVVTLPTCEKPGYTTHTCSKCNDTYKDSPTEATGHKNGDPVTENDVPATCLVNGSYDEVVYCAVCKVELSREQKTHVAPGHTEAVKQDNIQDATCTKPGSYDNVTYCKVCDTVLKTETVTGVTLPHTYTEELIDEDHKKADATCYSPAVYYYDCINCGANAKADANKDSFTFTSGGTIAHTPATAVTENYVDSSCYAEGTYDSVVYCSVEACNAEISRTPQTVEKKAHTPAAAVEENYVDSTCYQEGSYDEVVYCSVCKAAGIDKEISRTGKTVEKKAHTPAVAVQESYVAPSCHTEGSYNEVVYCSVEACHAKISSTPKTVAKVAHTPGEAVREKVNDSTCYAEGTYDEVVYCSVCKADGKGNVEISREAKKIAKKDIHTPGTAVRENEIDSSCYATGSYDSVVYCSACAGADVKTELSRTPQTIAKKAHTPATAVTENYVDSSCYAEGSYEAVVYCSVEACNAEISRTPQTVEKKAHTPAAAVEENYVDSTCYQEGSYDEVVYCSVCKAAGIDEEISRTGKTVEKKAHTPAVAVQESYVAPSCHTEGSYDEVVYCSVAACNAKISSTPKTVAKVAHTPGEAVREKVNDSTCYAEGTYDEVVYCSVCKADGKGNVELSRETKTIEKKAHTPAEAVRENITDSTCYAEGAYEAVVYCSVEACHAEISRTSQAIAKKAHTPAVAVEENYVAPSCHTEGSYDEVVYCSVEACHAEISRTAKTVAKVAHTPAEAVTENVVAPKCEEDGSHDVVVYCSVCTAAGKTFEISRETVTDARTGHTDGEATVENNIAPDCENEGSYDTVVYCTVCGDELSRVTTTVDALGHTEVIDARVEPTCTATGLEKGSHCSVCNEVLVAQEVITAKGHAYEEIRDESNLKRPTATEKGYYTFTCKNDASHTMKEYVVRADYTGYNKVIDAVNKLMQEDIPAEDKAKLQAILDNRLSEGLLDSEQAELDEAVEKITDIITEVYPDSGFILEIRGATKHYAGTILNLKAVKVNETVSIDATNVQWTSSDDSIVFFSNGKLYAIGTGTVTLTATSGLLTATKKITIVEGGNIRTINFTPMANMHFIIEDYFAIFNGANMNWSDDYEIRFRVYTYSSFAFETYIVYINGVAAVPDEYGYYTVPANAGQIRVTVSGAVYDIDGEGTGGTGKFNFWEWLINLFRKIIQFFKDLFGVA